MADDKNFLSRWSQRKLQKKHEEEADAAAEAEPLADEDVATEAELEEPGAETAETERHPAEEIDIDSLTKDSDFTVFMQKGVPQEVKRRALRKLWTSDPVLANLDGLLDYDDLTTTHGQGPLDVATAWKIGRGFLTEDEVGLNAKETAEAEPADEDAPSAAAEDEAEETIAASPEDDGESERTAEHETEPTGDGEPADEAPDEGKTGTV